MPVILGTYHFYANQMTEAEEDYDNFKTIKWIVEINTLLREYYSIPFMQPYLSEQEELENYEKRMELRKRIKLLKKWNRKLKKFRNTSQLKF